MVSFRFSILAVWACVTVGVVGRDGQAQILGANFNERPRDANVQTFEASSTTWSRGFLDVFQKENVGSLANDSDIIGLRRAADAGLELMVSFKWNFDGNNRSVPVPGSSTELNYFNRAVQMLQAVGRPINTVVLGNEPMWETIAADQDFTSGPSPYVPIVNFTERLRDHIHNNYGSSLDVVPRYFIGALNRLDQNANRNRPDVQEFLRVTRENAGIDGLDLHVHFNTMAQAQSMIQYGRQQLGAAKDMLVTEYSPVWAYQDNLPTAIGSTAAGQQFAQQYGYSPTLRVDQYLTSAYANGGQVSRQEWTDFITSQPWYNERHVRDMHALFRQHNVSIATQGFFQPTSFRNTNAAAPGWAPYNINWLYIQALVSGTFLEAYNAPYMADWINAQTSVADVNRDGVIDLHDYMVLVDNSGVDLSTIPFFTALTMGDLNLDRRIDSHDLDSFTSLYQLAYGTPFDAAGPADVDGNGVIDGHDWEIMLANLGRNLAGEAIDPSLWRGLGDTNQSGEIDRVDFRYFKSAYAAIFGPGNAAALDSTAKQAIPEPSTLAYGAVTCLVGSIISRQHRRLLCSWLIATLLVLDGTGEILAAEGAANSTTLILGANFNESWQAARMPTLKAAQANWIRGFLPAFEFIDGTRDLANDDRIKAFQMAADAGCKVVLSLKWDFRRAGHRVPPPDSERERECFDWAVDATKTCRPDLLCLVNESFIDSDEADLHPDQDGDIPIVVFMQRLATHMRTADLRAADGGPLPVGSGGFTLLFDEEMQSRPAVHALLEWLNETDSVDIVNFHIHHSTIDEIESSLRFVRSHVKVKPLAITEFSRVWAYGKYRQSPIGSDESGRAFALKYRRDPNMTVQEFLNSCYTEPVPEAEFGDFLASQSWFDSRYLEKACKTMDRYNVALATYAFVQEASGGRRRLRHASPLWCLNPIFADLMTVSSDPARPGINAGLYNAFVARQRTTAVLQPGAKVK